MTNIEEYGIDENEVWQNEEDYGIVVPETRVPLIDPQTLQLSSAYDHILELFQDENGIETYQIMLNMVHAFSINLRTDHAIIEKHKWHKTFSFLRI